MQEKMLSGTIKTTYYGFTTNDNKGLQRDALTTVFYYVRTSNFQTIYSIRYIKHMEFELAVLFSNKVKNLGRTKMRKFLNY